MGVRLILLLPLAFLFLLFGILMMITAYHQDNPIVFLALFFSSSLIVLISLACLVGLVIRVVWPLPPPVDEEEPH